MQFSELGLSPALLSALARKGYQQATPIQAQAIPAVTSGRDVLAAAQTGTGKTAAFTLPILDRLNAAPTGGQRRIRALILTPTRELAAQVEDNLRGYGAELPLKSTVIFGGVSAVPQTKILRRGVDILVATPGRLLDLIQQGIISLSSLEVFVLDEADRMLDMGFIHDIRRVLKLLPAKRQNLMFSATFSGDIEKLARQILVDPVSVDVAPRNSATELVEQRVVHVGKTQKRELLSWLIDRGNWQQVLVFTRTKHGANRLAKQLTDDGLRSAAIHGNKSQGARTKALAEFKAGSLRVLVATDIAARGLDIQQLPHVINYELPHVAEDYVHRIGRTGRAGSSGEAVSLVDREERPQLKGIEKLLGRAIPVQEFEDFLIKPQSASAPSAPAGSGRQAPGGQRHNAGRPGSSRRRNRSRSGGDGRSGRRPA